MPESNINGMQGQRTNWPLNCSMNIISNLDIISGQKWVEKRKVNEGEQNVSLEPYIGFLFWGGQVEVAASRGVHGMEIDR